MQKRGRNEPELFVSDIAYRRGIPDPKLSNKNRQEGEYGRQHQSDVASEVILWLESGFTKPLFRVLVDCLRQVSHQVFLCCVLSFLEL